MENKKDKLRRGSQLKLCLLNLGKLVLDVAKLCFLALVLGAFIKWDFPPSTMLTVGIIASGAAAAVGLALITVNEEK